MDFFIGSSTLSVVLELARWVLAAASTTKTVLVCFLQRWTSCGCSAESIVLIVHRGGLDPSRLWKCSVLERWNSSFPFFPSVRWWIFSFGTFGLVECLLLLPLVIWAVEKRITLLDSWSNFRRWELFTLISTSSLKFMFSIRLLRSAISCSRRMQLILWFNWNKMTFC